MGRKIFTRISTVSLHPSRNFTAHGRGNIISTALFISSSMKLLPILTAIWEYDVPASARAVGWAVVVNNIEALTSNSPLKWYVADCSFIGDNVFEYANSVIAGSVDTRVNMMD